MRGICTKIWYYNIHWKHSCKILPLINYHWASTTFKMIYVLQNICLVISSQFIQIITRTEISSCNNENKTSYKCYSKSHTNLSVYSNEQGGERRHRSSGWLHFTLTQWKKNNCWRQQSNTQCVFTAANISCRWVIQRCENFKENCHLNNGWHVHSRDVFLETSVSVSRALETTFVRSWSWSWEVRSWPWSWYLWSRSWRIGLRYFQDQYFIGVFVFFGIFYRK